jgi:predicted GNAT superfamily acetyltransferase
MANITISQLSTMQEFSTVSRLEVAIWGMEPLETTSPHLMMALTLAGGVALGAFDGEEMIGFAYGVPARRKGEWVLWSHITGVLPAYQGRNIGFRLKQAQREWAMANDYRVIAWTFDPMRRGNANFNLHRLGCYADVFHHNRYGEMTDGLNAGMASDRLEAVWVVDSARVHALAQGDIESQSAPQTPVFLLRAGDNDDPQTDIPGQFTAAAYAIEIPCDLNTLKAADAKRARQWQDAVRVCMQAALEAGYKATDFITEADRCWYVLTPDRK